jgi:acetyl-CoA carboxylase carboxyltransferase component
MSDERHLDALEALQSRLRANTDEERPDAVARRRKTNQRTARENIDDLVDEGSFLEYGALVLAAQRNRYSNEELLAKSPADGLITGIGAVEGGRTMVLAYDYTVFAGTQGLMSHQKLDRMLGLAADQKLPVVLFAEGGGGRPNDTDIPVIAGLHTPSFLRFAALSGLAPRVGIASGRCFAGNAALLGLCDVVIATENSSIGMGGPAMIEGGGLGKFAPEEVGPIDLQTKSGVVDIRVGDEREAVAVAKKYLAYFRGSKSEWSMEDQLPLREAMPERRRRDLRDARAP